MPQASGGASASQDELAFKLRQVMPEESTVDLDEHARRISLITWLGKLRGPRKILEETGVDNEGRDRSHAPQSD